MKRRKFESLPSKIISHRTCKQFNEEKFEGPFLSYLNDLEMSVDVFEMISLNALNSFAPVRRKISS